MAERFLIEARNLTLAIEDGVIAMPSGSYKLALRFPDAEVRPGLINAHDHLHRNHYGRLGGTFYEDSYAWVADVRRRFGSQIAAGEAMPRRRMLLHGAWKNLAAGVTTVVHHDRWEPDFESCFPLRVVQMPWANSLGIPPGVETIDPSRPFLLHLAEGRNARAANEVRQLEELGLLGPNLMAVHGNAMDADAIGRFRASGAALVWCPSSNLFLFGTTAPDELLAEGVDVLLGTDSLLTGCGDLLDELRLARRLGVLNDCRLEAAVGATAARRLGIERPSLEPGRRADLLVMSKPLLEASACEVRLVVADGVPRVADAALASELNRWAPSGRLVSVGGNIRWINGEGFV